MKNQLLQNNMLPEGTEVYYNGMYGVVRFTCEEYMTVCVSTFPEKVRDVCILVYKNQLDKLELVRGNHSHES
jgi:hypothetical protein